MEENGNGFETRSICKICQRSGPFDLGTEHADAEESKTLTFSLNGSVRRWWSLKDRLSVLGHPLAVALICDGPIEAFFGLHLLID